MKTYATATLEITCPEEWTKAQDFARENRDDSLMLCITRLLSWRSRDKNKKIVVSKDYMDYSFYFVEIYSDGKTGVNGGIIYYGKPAEKDGPYCYKYGWNIHT